MKNVIKNVMISDTSAYQIHTAITSTELLKG